METLGLRMERACENAMNLAKYIDSIDGIIVNYPGLESSKWHEKADKVLNWEPFLPSELEVRKEHLI